MISQPLARLVTLTAATVSPVRASFAPNPSATRVTVFALFTTAGTLQVYREATDGSLAQIGSNVAVSANTLSVTTYDYNTGPIQLLYTPTTAPTTGYIEAQYAGHTRQ